MFIAMKRTDLIDGIVYHRSVTADEFMMISYNMHEPVLGPCIDPLSVVTLKWLSALFKEMG